MARTRMPDPADQFIALVRFAKEVLEAASRHGLHIPRPYVRKKATGTPATMAAVTRRKKPGPRVGRRGGRPPQPDSGMTPQNPG